MQLLLEKIAKNHDFGDFWWFSFFWHDVTYDVTVTSYKVCFEFFLYRWTREGHSYSLVPHTWCFIDRFPRSYGGWNPPPSGCEMGQNNPALLGLNSEAYPATSITLNYNFQTKIQKSTLLTSKVVLLHRCFNLHFDICSVLSYIL